MRLRSGPCQGAMSPFHGDWRRTKLLEETPLEHTRPQGHVSVGSCSHLMWTCDLTEDLCRKAHIRSPQNSMEERMFVRHFACLPAPSVEAVAADAGGALRADDGPQQRG